MTEIQKVIIYYFSGTGNALSVANWIKDVALEMSREVELHDISKIEGKARLKLHGHTLIGFISPTHGFNFPPIMLHFLFRFPKGNGHKIFIVNTRGGLKMGKYFLPGLSGMAQYFTSILLSLKGYKVVGMRPIDLPSNWISLHPGLKTKVIQSIFKKRREQTEQFAHKIFSNKQDLTALRDIVQDLLISPIAILYYFFGRYLFAKSFVATAKCNLCKLCIKSCPVKAIKLVDNRPYWSHTCESCMKCMNQCPERAIETAHGFVSAIVVLVNTVILFSVYNSLSDSHWLKAPGFISYFSSMIFDTVILLLCLMVGYRLMHWLMRFRFFERIIAYSSLTRFAFWRRYQLKKIKFW